MASQIGRVRSVAKTLADAADVAIRKAQIIRSPSHKQFDNGAYIGQGLIDGIASKIRAVKVVSSKLAGTFSPQLGMAGIGGGALNMSEDYSYGHIAQYEVTVVTELDGDVVAKKTVKPMQKELNKLDKRDSRYRGRI